MWFKHITPKWYYIDPTQPYHDSATWNPADHDGSTIDRANIELPAVLEDNTVYLIRRSNHKWTTVEGTSFPLDWCYTNKAGSRLASGALRVAIVGMPKQDDPVYAYMPEDAKTQWGADASEWATLAQNYNVWINDHFVSLNARDVCIYNLRMRTYSRRDDSADVHSLSAVIGSTCENFEASKIYACNMHGDILDPTDVSGVWFNSSNNNYRFNTGMVFNVTYTNTCHIHDCTFIQKPDNSDSGGYVRLHSRFGNCSIHDIQLHNIPLASERSEGDYAGNCHNGFFHITSEDTYRSLSKVSVHDIQMYLYKNITVGRYGRFRSLLTGQANLWNVHSITVEEAADENQLEGANSYRTPRTYFISLSAFNPGSIIDGITFNLPKCKGLRAFQYYVGYIDDANGWFFTPKSQWHIVKNISFIGTGEGKSSVWGDNCCVISITNDNARNDNRTYNYLNPTCDQLIVQNINLTAYYNTASDGLYIKNAMLDMSNNHIQGKVTLQKCTGKLGSIKTYAVGGALTDTYGGNLVYIGSITCNRNNPDSPYTGQQAIEPSWRSQILVGSTNTKFIRDNNFSNSDINNNNDHMYLCTSDTLEGNFVARNKPAKAETWSVYRTGGHTCTLRFLCEISDIASYPLRIGDLPFAGIKRHLQKGINKCTFFMTTFGYNNPAQIKDKMRFRAKLPSGLYVGSNGTWDEDSETVWNNIELHTPFKYTFYIEMEEEGDVEFSYQFWWYMLGGYTYLDPFPQVELQP